MIMRGMPGLFLNRLLLLKMPKPQSLKQKLSYLILIDLIFLILAFLLLIFTRTYIQNSLNHIQSYQSSIEQLKQDVETNTSLILNYEGTLTSLEKISSKTLTFIFIIFPLILFLLFAFSQYIIWKIVKKKNFIKDFKKDFLRFLMVSLIFFITLILMIYFLRFNLIILLIAIFAWFYLLTNFYLNFENLKKIKFDFKDFLLISLLFLICLIILFIFLYAYIKTIAKDKNFWFLLWLILFLPLKGLLRIFLNKN